MRVLYVSVACMLALWVPGPSAKAGVYTVWSCAGPSRQPLPATGWLPQSAWGTIRSTCGSTFGALSGELNAGEVPSGSYARWTFEAPRDTTIASVMLQRAAGASSGGISWYRSYFAFRDSPVPEVGYGLDVCVVASGLTCEHPGDAAHPFAAASRFVSLPFSAGRLILSAQCDGPMPCAPRSPSGWFKVYQARIAIADAFPPVFRRPPSGSLIAGALPVSGERSVSFDGTDRGGGMRAVELLVDGQPVTTTTVAAGRCKEPFNDPVPCPPAASGQISLDTSVVENGSRKVQVALVDAAGNRTLSDPTTIAVHNDKGPNGVGFSRMARLRAALPDAHGTPRSTRTVDFGARAVVRGRLLGPQGVAISGAELHVLARLDRLGARERRIATIATGADGRFRWTAPRGPSRYLRIAYRAFESDPADTASAEVKLAVRPAIRLRVRPRVVRNGGRIAFRGRLVGGPGRAGAQVTLEAVGRDVRHRVPVATLRTDAAGRFRFSYRFLRSFAPFTYRFRARLIRQASYPYVGGSSRVVTVRIVR